MFHKLFFSLIISTCFCSFAVAQTHKKVIDEKFYAFDLYPFELAEGNGKWGLMLKPVYDRELALSYFKRNFHYNTRLDTLPGCGWLAQPHYDKFERWNYGPRFQFMVGTYGNKIDVFTIHGELLGKEVSDLLPEKTGDEQKGVIITMTTGGRRKWFYEGDFYNANTTIHYQSALFDKMEVLRDTASAVFNFITEKQGRQQVYNELGHEVDRMLAYEFKKAEVPAETLAAAVVKKEPEKEIALADVPLITESKEKQQKTVTEEKQEVASEDTKSVAENNVTEPEKVNTLATVKTNAAQNLSAEAKLSAEKEQKSKREAQIRAAVVATEENTRSVAENNVTEPEKEIPLAATKNNAKENLSAEAKLSAEKEQKAKREAEIKAAVVKAIREAEEAGLLPNGTSSQKEPPVEKAQKAATAPEVKEAVESLLKQAQEQEEKAKIARQEKIIEDARRAAEAEKARLLAEAKQEMNATAAVSATAGPAKTEKQAVPTDAGAILTDRNIIMHKIMDREQLATYIQYKENELWGLQTAEGKVLINPVFKSINMIHPTNPELKYANVFAAIELDMNGTIIKITNPNFAGPESLGTHKLKCAKCKGGFKTAEVKWDKVTGKYVY